jgi:hypothetical protein
MHTDLLEDPVSTGKPSLSDPAIVDALVRHFAKRVFDTQAAWQLGQPGARDPLMLIEQDARQMGAIMLGHDSAYDATPWNSDNRLGMYSGSCCQRKRSTTDALVPRCSCG